MRQYITLTDVEAVDAETEHVYVPLPVYRHDAMTQACTTNCKKSE